ncbi:hypothetical protein KJ781_04280, partial [Patescibacteria group bacterium]|nr:hypothetical protein [Patescibacteria group bacterium]
LEYVQRVIDRQSRDAVSPLEAAGRAAAGGGTYFDRGALGALSLLLKGFEGYRTDAGDAKIEKLNSDLRGALMYMGNMTAEEANKRIESNKISADGTSNIWDGIAEGKRDKDIVSDLRVKLDAGEVPQVFEQAKQTPPEGMTDTEFNLSRDYDIDPMRIREIKDNMDRFMQESGLSAEDARQWALVGKGPTHPEFFAINQISRDLGGTVPLEGTQEEQDLRISQGLDGVPRPGGEWIRTSGGMELADTKDANGNPAVTDKKTGDITSADPNTGATVTTPNPDVDLQKRLEAGNKIIDDTDLPQYLKDIYKKSLKSWSVNSLGNEVNFKNVMAEFENVKKTTIDPDTREAINSFTRDTNQAIEQEALQRSLETEQEQAIFGERDRAAKQALEASGKTFSGEGVEKLGEGSAYARAGSEAAKTAATPLQQPFGGTFTEGTIPQANRLMATSSLARNRSRLEEIGKQAERTLGTESAMNLVPGFTPVEGGIELGTIETARRGAESAALTSATARGRQQELYKEPLI